MREIKLRAWDIEANDWAYGTLNIKRFRFDMVNSLKDMELMG